MKKVLKVAFIILLIFAIFYVLSIDKTYATGKSIGDVVEGADEFIGAANPNDKHVIQEDDMIEMSNLLYNTLLVLAIIILVIVGFIIGIKIMTDSAAEKAKTKEMLIPYIAGCIVVFGAFGIWKLVVNLLTQTQ